MKKILLLTFFAISSCGYDGNYRYPCQDPVNWEKKECNPPICIPSGDCTKDVIGTNPWKNVTVEKNYTQD